jgi:hypothetical protein
VERAFRVSARAVLDRAYAEARGSFRELAALGFWFPSAWPTKWSTPSWGSRGCGGWRPSPGVSAPPGGTPSGGLPPDTAPSPVASVLIRAPGLLTR